LAGKRPQQLQRSLPAFPRSIDATLTTHATMGGDDLYCRDATGFTSFSCLPVLL
jgi:hypothetical protein